ncbi:MAG TPA: DUF1385 domain-containing protein, partial [Armatimonadetes bacterium]|nr:DUF1385 domain-containing protein [Armatimonadota bacterium]
AAQLFATVELPVLPVVDEQGRLRGLISRADVASALCHALRPSRVAGMSTPLGVYLTSGAHRGGANDFGLFLTGAAMAILLFIAQFMVKIAFHIVDITTGLNLLSLYQDAGELMLQSDLAMSVSALGMLLQVIFFFALMRMLPLAGYHGAEHKVVHAIERGEMLTAERVLSMPRVHPRCGTNIVAMILLFLTIYFGRPSMWLTIILVGVVVLTWRRLGMLLQALFTTKNPTPKQLESALRAGRELLAHYHERPNYRPPFVVALWNMGFIQAFAGFGTMHFLGVVCSWIIDHFIVV